MPNFNWGNGNGYGNRFGNGSSWSMPNFNWGNGNGYGNRFGNGTSMNMPNFNWGSGNNGFGNGSNWGMPKFNWNNNSYNPYNNSGSNWNMPSFNMGSNNPPPPGIWRNNQNYNTYIQPNRGIAAPARPRPPVFNGNMQARPQQNMGTMKPATPVARPKAPAPAKIQMPTQKPVPAAKPVAPATSQNAPKKSSYPPIANETNSVNIKTNIPTPAQVKGVILAPENKPENGDAADKATTGSDKKSVTQTIKEKINNAVKKITE
jgi:hypothetical protein